MSGSLTRLVGRSGGPDMEAAHRSRMQPISPAHRRLGAALREARKAAGINTRSVPSLRSGRPFFSSSHISLVENGLTTPSRELIDSYVHLAGDGAKLRALYAQIMAAADEAARRRRGVEVEQDVVAPQEFSEGMDRSDIQRHYVVESSSAHCTFDGGGVLRELAYAASVRAITPGVRLCYAGHSYAADPRPGVLTMGRISGAELSTTKESPNGTLQSYFRLDRPLSPQDPDPYVLQYQLIINSDVRTAPRLRFQAEAGNHHLSVRATFAPPALPRQIWWTEAPSGIDADYPRADRTMKSELADFQHSFDRLVPTWIYGLDWIW